MLLQNVLQYKADSKYVVSYNAIYCKERSLDFTENNCQPGRQ